MSIRSLIVLAAVALSACGVESPDEAASWDTATPQLERGAVLACTNTQSSYTATVGDATCEAGFGNFEAVNDDGSCPPGYLPGTASTGELCDIATQLLEEPGECPYGCDSEGLSGVSTSGSARSCTASQYRECGAQAKPGQVDGGTFGAL